jgi:hypothetical protein
MYVYIVLMCVLYIVAGTVADDNGEVLPFQSVRPTTTMYAPNTFSVVAASVLSENSPPWFTKSIKSIPESILKLLSSQHMRCHIRIYGLGSREMLDEYPYTGLATFQVLSDSVPAQQNKIECIYVTDNGFIEAIKMVIHMYIHIIDILCNLNYFLKQQEKNNYTAKTGIAIFCPLFYDPSSSSDMDSIDTVCANFGSAAQDVKITVPYAGIQNHPIPKNQIVPGHAHRPPNDRKRSKIPTPKKLPAKKLRVQHVTGNEASAQFIMNPNRIAHLGHSPTYPSPPLPVPRGDDRVNSNVIPFPSPSPKYATSDATSDVHSNLDRHSVCTVQVFMNPFSGLYMYMFAAYYLKLGYLVIIYDRFGNHRSFIQDFLSDDAFVYYPYTASQLAAPEEFSDKYKSEQVGGMCIHACMCVCMSVPRSCREIKDCPSLHYVCLYACMYVSMYVCMYVRIYVFMHVYLYACMNVRI